jgi:uncharacterized surface protein with fasciclin (FAS1) repeats
MKTKIPRSLNLILSGLAFLLAFSACMKNNKIVPNPGAPSQTITQIVESGSNFTLLKEALIKTGLDQTLSGTGPFTVFAPTDAAFIAAGFPNTAAIDAANLDTLKSILLYHTLSGSYPVAQIPAGSTALASVNGKSVFISKNGIQVYINGIAVTSADNLATNGVVHIIGSVLTVPTKNIVALAQSNSNLTYLVAAVLRASTGTTNVASVLSGKGPFTLFAPTNAAFIAAGFPTIASINTADPNALTNILTTHVISGEIFSSDLTNGPSPATLNGVKLTINISGTNPTVSAPGNSTPANIIAANNIVLNGVVHVIDQVLIPVPSIAQIVASGPNFTLLKEAVIKSGLLSTLSNPGTFTVFAPTDSAFNAAGFKTTADIDALNPDTLKSIILYHALTTPYFSTAIPTASNTPLVSANGKTVYVTKNSKGVFVNGIPVKIADVPASNGVIHVIGSVLFPPTKNLVALAQSNPNLTYLVAAIIRASSGSTNVLSVLSGSGPFTVLAPTNAAFIAAGFPTIAAIQSADPNTLASILTLHVFGARIFSSDLASGTSPATLNGETLTFNLSSGATVSGKGNKTAANIVQTNILAFNGVVHVIDQVLLP